MLITVELDYMAYCRSTVRQQTNSRSVTTPTERLQ